METVKSFKLLRYFNYLIRCCYTGEIQIISADNAVLGVIDFRNLKALDYELIAKYGNKEGKVVNYIQFLTNPPIDCYTIKLVDEE